MSEGNVALFRSLTLLPLTSSLFAEKRDDVRQGEENLISGGRKAGTLSIRKEKQEEAPEGGQVGEQSHRLLQWDLPALTDPESKERLY